MDNMFESTIYLVCAQLSVPVELFKPEPGGRDQVFFRDIEMVREADLVICVFNEGSPMEGGTAHVVEKAQDRRVPVYAYTDDGDGHWSRLGEWDPEDTWAHRVPRG
jgi:nucleoside 2-deoxyribosyltransferase